MTCIVISMASFPEAVQQIRVSSREQQSSTSTAQYGLPRQRKEVKPQLPKVGNVITDLYILCKGDHNSTFLDSVIS